MLKISRALALTLMVSASLATTTHASSEIKELIKQRLLARGVFVTDQQAKQLEEDQSNIIHVVAASQRGQDVSFVLLTPAEQAAKTYLTTNLTAVGGAGGLAAVINNPTKEQIKAASLLIAGGIANPDDNDLNAGVKCLAVGINAPSDEEFQGALHLTTALGIPNPSKNQIQGAAAFITGGHAAPLQVEVNGWVADNTNGGRAARVLVAAVGLDSTDADLIAAAKRCVVVDIAAPTDNQINGAHAFITGGHAAPSQVEIDEWANNAGTRDECVLVAVAGLDATDADLIAAATRCIDGAVGINNPTAHQLQGARYLMATIVPNIAAPTRNQINGAAAFIAGGDNAPTLPEIGGWINNPGTRAQRVLVGAAGLDATNAPLIGAATRCIAAGIAAPNANQLNAALDLIAALAVNGLVDPTQNEINDVANAGAGRAARIAAISAAGGAGRIA